MYPVVQERTAVLLEILRQTGPDKPFHVEDLMLRLIMDTTGQIHPLARLQQVHA